MSCPVHSTKYSLSRGLGMVPNPLTKLDKEMIMRSEQNNTPFDLDSAIDDLRAIAVELATLLDRPSTLEVWELSLMKGMELNGRPHSMEQLWRLIFDGRCHLEGLSSEESSNFQVYH